MPTRDRANTRFEEATEHKTESTQNWELTYNALSEKHYLIFREPVEDDVHVEVTKIMEMGGAGRDLCEAYARAHSMTKSADTRRTAFGNFVKGFSEHFESAYGRLDKPSDVPEDYPKQLLAWLKVKLNPEGEVVAAWTQLHYYSAMKKVFLNLIEFRPEAGWKLSFPENPFKGVDFTSKATEVDFEKTVEFMACVCRDVVATIEDVVPNLERLREEMERQRISGHVHSWNRITVAAHLLLKYGAYLPMAKELKESDPVEHQRIKDAGGYSSIRKLAYPSTGDLVPFYYLMAFHTGFNQQPLADLSLPGIQEDTLFGEPRTLLVSPKNRADGMATASFVDSGETLAPDTIVKVVLDWTHHIRQHAPERFKSHLWLCIGRDKRTVRRKGDDRYDSLARLDKTKNGLNGLMLNYCKKNDFEYIGTRITRANFAALYEMYNPGDREGLRILLNHKSITTSRRNYRSIQGEAAAAELLAGGMNHHQRWLESNGKVDSRDPDKTKERSAATPGFICSDPYESPIVGQRLGRLCTAYGQCPACPLASLEQDKPYALARLFQLEDLLEASKKELGINIWKKKYQVVDEKLTQYWIPQLRTHEVLVEAVAQRLSTMPDLE